MGLRIWLGGASTVTIIIGGLPITYLVAKLFKLNWLKVMDLYSPGLIFGQGVQKIGCFMAGCCYGRPTNSIFGVVFNAPGSLAPKGIKIHPTQLYESVGDFLIFIFIWKMRRKLEVKGQLFALYILSYSILRFFVEFLRADSYVLFINDHFVRIPQILCIIGIIISVMYLKSTKDKVLSYKRKKLQKGRDVK
jgi:phosphatidylglycerol:prolipoprotein diacylglycerol transferase